MTGDAGDHERNPLLCLIIRTPYSERMWFMPAEPVPADPGSDDDLAWLDRDPMTAEERAAWLDRVCETDEPPEPEEGEDFDPLTPEELAEIREAAADELLAVKAATTGRRGPGQPGSARVFPGESSSPAAGFGPGMALDVLPGCAQLAVAADAAAGDENGFAGVSEAELVGLVCAWDRVEAHAAARKLAVIAELGRRNPAPEDAEFTADQVACALGESRARADELLGTAGHLDTHLPGTKAALMGRELPPDEVLAADQRICSWAGELRAAGLEGGMD